MSLLSYRNIAASGFVLSALVGSSPSAAQAQPVTPATASVATPTFAPKPGTYTSDQSVTIADATPKSAIYYTTNGATPTTASTKYTGPVTVAHSETLKAIATVLGDANSAVSSATYTIEVATPAFAPAAGSYEKAQSVKITDSTPNATIYYTTNGATPTTASAKYAAPISVKMSETLKAIAVVSGDTNSPVATGAYDILIAATPAFSVTAGIYNSVQKVSLSDKTPGATIYYTTDGSIPTTASAKYTSAIPVGTTETVRAIAAAAGFATSAVATASYQIILETVIHAFNYGVNGSTDGEFGYSALIQGSDGNFYGTTTGGGAFAGNSDGGTFFRVTPAGVTTTLYSFGATATGLSVPYAPLVEGKDGDFYGTTDEGGAYGFGGIFKVTPDGRETVVYSFDAVGVANFGNTASNGLVLGTDGNFYGMTQEGGGSGCFGTVYKLSTSGGVTTLDCFPPVPGDTAGSEPMGNLIEASDGNFYGTNLSGGTYGLGSVFKITPTGKLTVVHSFGNLDGTGAYDGAMPLAGLVQATDGNLYGTTLAAGGNDGGIVFRITLAGYETVLHSFDLMSYSSTDGSTPQSSLIQGSDGNLYGTTGFGGINGEGTIYRISLSGTETVLLSFDGDHGASPQASLIEAPNGDLYGITTEGGAANQGVVFKLTGAITAAASH